MTAKTIAENCLNAFWNSGATDIHGGGWDRGSNAHRHATQWATRNIRELNKLSWPKIFQAYQKTLVQE